LHGFSGPLGLNRCFGGKTGEGVMRYWP